jgi:hypothetical protein
MANPVSIAKVILDGVDLGTKPGAKFNPGGKKHTTQMASGKITGPSYEPLQSSITCAFEYTADTDLDFVRKFRGPITVEYDNGDVWTISEGWIMNSADIGDAGRGADAQFEGQPAELT